MIYEVERIETKHFAHWKTKVDGKWRPVKNEDGSIKHKVNSGEFNILHSMTVHPSGWALDANGNKKRAFKTQEEVIPFLVENSISVSAHVLIMPSGKRYEYYVSGIPDDELSCNHAGKSSWKNKVFLNTKSFGAELIRMANNPIGEQYTLDQYKSAAEFFYYRNPKPFVDDHATHAQIAPGRKTDPDFFDMGLYWQEYQHIVDASLKKGLDSIPHTI